MSSVKHLLVFMTYKFWVRTAIKTLNREPSVQIIKFELYKIDLNYALLYNLDDRKNISLLSHLWKLPPKLELRTLAGYNYPLF